MGCGWVGAQLAALLDSGGHTVSVLDIDAASFGRLPPNFGGTALLCDGTDEDALRGAGIEQIGAFIVVTDNDNLNIMSAQLAKHLFGVPRVICRLKDPMLEELYQTIGLETIAPATIIAQLLKDKLVEGET